MSKIDVFHVVLSWFSLIEQIFLKKIFSWACTLRGKYDVKLPFGDSYICYVSKIDLLNIFVLVFTNGSIFSLTSFAIFG